MYRYCDYFPRRILYRCGISPETELSVREAAGYRGEDRHGRIGGDMKQIYAHILDAMEAKGMKDPAKAAGEMEIGRRIVSAFYDMGILTEQDRERYPVDGGQALFSGERARERLSIEELSERARIEQEPISKPSELRTPQKGRELQ